MPDQEFPPLLSAYLSADAFVVPGLQPARRAELIQLLVPVAAHNPTALDTVLARLLIAVHFAGWVDKSLLGQFEQAGYPGRMPQLDEHTAQDMPLETPSTGTWSPVPESTQ